ncbi:murein hydrolase activator EnvC family protein [Rhodohalobacter halophilus]|uniref:murein hydrolase activator EnvC family protein n=1 Tax=Rhodohalobacter halophilus TaxID=1812810 RepID=UPI00083F9AD0|nr:peptidoglycan DD-metalloendopeptidase family protein [Rhodohalobacter halophilus]
MTIRYFLTGLLICFISIAAVPAAAQDSYEEQRAELMKQQSTTRSQIETLQEQIESYNERLGYATERYDEMFRQYQEMERVIALQQENIRQMMREQNQITAEIELIEQNIVQLQQRLEKLINDYKETLSFLYKNGRTTELALLLSSGSFNQLLVRSYYLGKFDEYQKEQADQIQQAQVEYEESVADLEVTLERNEEALATIREETKELEQRREMQERNVQLLRRDRDNLQEQLEIHRRQLNELTQVLETLEAEEERIRIAEEERRRRLAEASEIEDEDERRAAEARYSRPILRESGISNEELLAFEERFETSRGQLPWPVDNGTITQKFGIRTHPVFNTQTNFPGIEIAAVPGSTVRVVNDGYVFGIQNFLGFGDVVMVHHGAYKTMYGNMSEVYVRKNQVLQEGDVIGLSGDENSANGEVIIFMIAEGSEYIDPQRWLQSEPVP